MAANLMWDIWFLALFPAMDTEIVDTTTDQVTKSGSFPGS